MSGTFLSLTGASLTEFNSSSNFLTFTATLSEAAASSFNVFYRTIGGTALADVDYNQIESSFTFSAGQTSKTFTVQVFGDTLDELDESVVVELFNPGGGIVFEGGQPTLRTTGVIYDDDGSAPNLALFVSDPQIVEGDSGLQQALFELRLSRPATAALTVDYATANGSALAGSDYTAKSGSVTFAVGQDTAYVAVNVLGNAAAEATEAFFLNVTPRSGAAVATTSGTATILDDDTGGGLPVLSVSGASLTEFNSSSNFLTFTATLSEAAASSFNVFYRTIGGTALADVDYNQIESSFTFSAGQTSKTFTVQVFGDTLDELDESVVVELFNPGGGIVFEGGQPTLRTTGVIYDDDGSAPNLALFVSDPQIVEGDSGLQQALFELRLSRPATAALTVDYATANGSALAGSDYTAKSGSVTFAVGQDTAYVAVNVLGNAAAEATEAFFLNVTPRSGAAVATTSGTATILDDDTGGGLPVLSVSGASLTEFNSSSNFLTFTATLSEAAASSFNVFYRTIGGTALADVDYNQIESSFTFSAGQTSKTFTVQVFGDTLDELDESVVVELFNPGGGIVFEGGQPTLRTTGVIYDDDGSAPNLALFVSDPQIVEGDSGLQQALFELRLSRPATAALTVDYATANGSALAGSDYTAKSGSVTFAVGQDTAYVAVNVLGNAAAEATEAFFLNVTPRSGAAVATTSGTATILDDDTGGGLPVLSVSGASLTEFNSSSNFLTFTATLSEAAASSFNVFYRTIGGTALADVDYNQIESSFTFSAGQTSKTFTVQVFGDTLDELDESVVVELFNPGGGIVFEGGQPTLRTTGVIYDDDGSAPNLALFVSDPQIVEGDSGLQQALFELRLSRPATAALTVDYATANGSALAGSDYTAKSGSVTFAVGQDTAYVAVNVLGNAAAEATEAFFLNVTPRSGAAVATTSGTATILDDDTGGGLPVLSVSGASLTEFNSSSNFLTFTATLSEAAASSFNVFYRTIGGTALADVDYNQIESSFTFSAGQTSKTFTVQVFGDTAIEPNETVVVELFNLGGGVSFAGGGSTLRTTGVILNDDAAALGSAGNDTINGTPVGDLLQGANGNDVLNGLDGPDSLIGGPGNDTLDGGAGSDTLDGGPGADLLRGGPGDDFYRIDQTADTIVEAANAGIDTVLLTGASAAAYVLGAGVERAFVLDAARRVTGNGLDNLIVGGGSADTLLGGVGNDTLDGGNGNDRLYGSVGNDLYIVGGQTDVVVEAAGSGVDTVRTSAAKHVLQANVENLEVSSAIAHSLTGNGLNNLITGDIAADTIWGGAGDDTLDGGFAADRLLGGAGNDFYIATPGDTIVEGVNQGIDTVSASAGPSFALSANVEVLLLGSDQNMNGIGNGLGNRIEGNGATNVLYGLAGADSLLGGGGADILIGGAGKDYLTGGTASDQFRFTTVADSTFAAPDVILDLTFVAGQQLDRVDLRLIDANPFLAGNQAFSYIGAAAFDGDGAASAGQLRVTTLAAGRFQAEADLDGNGAAEFAVEIHSANAPAASWFLL